MHVCVSMLIPVVEAAGTYGRGLTTSFFTAGVVGRGGWLTGSNADAAVCVYVCVCVCV